MQESPALKPMPLWMSVLVLCILVAIGIASLYLVVPALDRAGAPMFWNYTLTTYGMFPLLLILALVGYRLEGRKLSIAGLLERFRIGRLDKKEWLWTLGLLVVYVGGNLLLLPTAGWLASILPLPLPEALPPAVDPRVAQSAVPTEFLGVPLRGNWDIGLVYLLILCLNIVGEELWWRGYILPRQELAHGKWAWLVHGLIWTLFHVPFWWNLIALLPSMFSLSFVTSRLKNTTPGIIVHSFLNGLGYLVMVLGILGIGI